MADVVTLHGVEPAEIFRSGLDHADEIHAVATSILSKDGCITAGWSNMDETLLARVILVLDERQRRATLAYEDLNLQGQPLLASA
jgi:hypothetical protein